MICPRCKADTKVVDSRPEAGGTVIRRRRICTDATCGHRFTTTESTLDVAARRKRAAAATAEYRKADPERARAQDARRHKARSLRAQAKAEAAETGEPLAKILARWGLSPPSRSSPPSSPRRGRIERPAPRPRPATHDSMEQN
ncbi:hypothetical protein NS228_06030 [Methylobacterium indicum]|uniref:NrdR family transcriptional regulator n=1 Tax=Methylobacterium indicum TaxID=1775910 RepID=UPI000734D7D7|nr:hypothetical protein NS229_14805 [Methylobacterium indicum]KTS41521.1 hypothetical protein NS228_06030 [Methylobacterium indicum]KTS52425.1 hypothetical protein NS230_09885 [Methylobacterium indicum]